mgnify:CR=1 FL=1
MAVVGSAFITVRALTSKFVPDLNKGLSGLTNVGEKLGTQFAGRFADAVTPQVLSKLGELTNSLEASRVEFRRVNNAARFLGPALIGLAGIIGALGGGLIVLGAAVGNAARALVVLPAGLLAVATAAITTRVALGGVGQALQAANQAQAGSAAASRAQEAALKRVTAARVKLKRLLEEEAPAELAAARERAADAARGAADALLSAERAQRGYNEAQRATLDATLAVTAAREEAVEKLQQLRFQVEGAAISEAKARLEFEKARDSLQAVQDLPPNSRARQEAELAFAQAELNLRKAIDNNSDLKKEEDAATKAGVEGSEEVLSAKEALAKAQQREADLAIDTARAYQQAAEAQKDAAEAAAAAAAGGTTERELNRRIAEAREALKEAEQAAARAASGGIDAYAQAIKDLSPEAIAFVEFLRDSRDAFLEFRFAAGRDLFGPLTNALEIFLAAGGPIQAILQETGGIVGEFAENLSTALFTGEGFERLQNVFGTNNDLLRNLGTAAVNLASAFLVVLEAAEPLITAFGEWAASSSLSFLEDLTSETSTLGETLGNAQRNFENLAGVIGTFFQALGVIGGTINQEGGAADTLLGGLQTRADDFLATMQRMADDGSLDDLFTGLANNFLLIFDAIAQLGGALLEIGATQGIKDLLTAFTGENGLIGVFREVGLALTEGEDSPVSGLATFIQNFGTLVKNLTSSTALESFFETLNGLLERFVSFTETDAFKLIFDNIGPILAQVAALGIAFRAAKFFVEVLAGSLLLLATPFLFFKNNPIGAKIVDPLKVAAKILGRFLGIAGLVIGIFVAMYANSEAFRTSLGAAFEAIGAAIQGAMDNINGVIQDVFPGVQGLGDLFNEIFGRLGDFFSGTLVPLIAGIISAVIGGIGGLIAGVFKIFDAFKTVFDAISNVYMGFVALFTGDFESAIGFFENALEGFKSFFVKLWEGLLAPVKGLFNGIIDAWNNTAGKFKVNIPDWVPFIGGREFSIPNIPRLAKGGIVPATPGGVVATIGEAGRPERVEPLDPDGLSRRDKAMIDRLTGGGAGATINVYPSPGMDERELADLVSRKLAYQMRRGSV